MTRTVPWRTTGLAAAALAVVSVLVAATGVMAAPLGHDAAPVRADPVDRSAYYAGCGDQAVAEPVSVPIWCQSADQRLEDLTWSSWGGSRALATGVFTDNPCDCAGGSVTTYPVAVRFDDPTTVGAAQRYGRLSITFAADRPAWAVRPTMHFLWGDLGFLTDQERP